MKIYVENGHRHLLFSPRENYLITEVIEGMFHFGIWSMLVFIGYTINTLVLHKENLFSTWNWDYLWFAAILSMVFALSKKIYIAAYRVVIGFFILVLIVSVVSFNEFDAEGLDMIDHGIGLMFPHNEIIFQSVNNALIDIFTPRWTLFTMCSVVIGCTAILQYSIFRASSSLGNSVLEYLQLRTQKR